MMNSKVNMYGCEIEDFVDSVVESITYQACGANDVIAGLLSDAQEQIAGGDGLGARQTLNRAKALIFRVNDGQLVGNRGIRK